MKTNLTHAQLLSALYYDANSGEFFWLGSGEPRKAGHLVSAGRYYGIGVNGRVYRRSRLAWFYVHGAWPVHHIDHINGNRHDDRISNLRDISSRLNNINMPCHRSGHLPGTSFDKRKNKWFARIKIGKRAKRLGHFHTQQEAHEAYKKAFNELK